MSERQERLVTVVNDSGLHARPCQALVTAALEYESELRIRCDGREVNGKSILELMTLGAARGAVLHLSAAGTDAAELLDRLQGLVRGGFGESS
jgi:phosphotransferase system HPr (HPr) family protein